MKNFALIGAAGYIAPRHMEAIKTSGNNLVASFDPFDSVGIIDKYFPECDFFTEFERFDRFIDKMKRKNISIDYFSICSPNYLHDSHIRYGLKQGADVICEKPLVINPWNLETLIEMENETRKRVNTILQLRLHNKIIDLKKYVNNSIGEKFSVNLEYITSRGKWYQSSWKGDSAKSGGVATNIGIHFFDMLIWVFGDVKELVVKFNNENKSSGILYFENAVVNWFLSIDSTDLPDDYKIRDIKTYRNLSINGKELEFSDGFTDLHYKSYLNILRGKGFSLKEALPAVKLTHNIRNNN